MTKTFKITLFSWELHKYLKRNKMSVQEFSKLAEVNYQTALNWLNGKSMPNNYSLDVIDYKTAIDALKYKDEEWVNSMIQMFNEGVEIHELF